MLPTDTDKAIDIAEIVIYSIVSLPAVYCLIRHGAEGFLGWLYLIVYSALRLAAGALRLKSDLDETTSSGAAIVENIGLSPLLLCTAGILHEARHARNANNKSRIEWVFVLLYYLLVTAALGLIAASISSVVSSHPSSSDLGLVKGSFAILFVAWAVVALAALLSLRRPDPYSSLTDNESFHKGTLLLNAVFFSLPMSLLRAIYSAILLIGAGSSFRTSAFSSNLSADVCMNFLPPMLAIIVFVVIGVLAPPRWK